MDNFMDNVREDFGKQAEEWNAKTKAWEEKIDKLYEYADSDLKRVSEYADSIIEYDKSLDKWKVSNLNTIVGEILFESDSIESAMERFKLSESLTFDSPRNKANKAGYFVKKGNYQKAMSLLKEASETNHDFKWLVGNLYEIQGQSKKAIFEYEFLYNKGQKIYEYCGQRISELQDPKTKPFKELSASAENPHETIHKHVAHNLRNTLLMIKIIEDNKQILKLHKKFQKQLNNILTEKINCYVGYPSGSFDATVRYSTELDIWLSSHEQHNRFWNGFGVGKPVENRNVSLNGEINFPFEGISRRVAGAFGIEDNGTILVLHRGKIGGGTKGIGKIFFTDNFRGDFVNAIDGNQVNRFCVVGELNSIHFPEQVSNFVNEIYRVKRLIKNPSEINFDFLENFSYTQEKSGTSKTDEKRRKTIERTHGIIVTELANELENLGFNIANDKNRDLFTYKKNSITNLFEIKTNCKTQSLYTAVGQLLIYSIPIPNKVKLIMVLPEKLDRLVTKRLKELGISILYFEWEEGLPYFPKLEKIVE